MELGGIRKIGPEKLFLISTTHGGETSSISAALPTMEVFEQNKVVQHNHTLGQKFIDGSKRIIEQYGLNHSIHKLQFNWHASLGYFDIEGNISFGLRTLFHQELIKRGVLFHGIFCPNFSHTNVDVEHLLSSIDDSRLVYKKGLEVGFEKYLIGGTN